MTTKHSLASSVLYFSSIGPLGRLGPLVPDDLMSLVGRPA